MNVIVPCTCPAKPNGEPRHAHDTITFRDRLDFRGGMVIRKAITMLKVEDPDSGAAEVLAAMSEHYMLEGISGWTLVDEKGKPVEASKTAIREFINDHQDIVVRRPGGRSRQPVRRAGTAPFSPEGADILAAFADGTIDVSGDWLGGNAPEAIAAILDFHYPDQRHHDDYVTARWRLQYIAESSVGARVRELHRQEDAKVRKLRSVSGGRC